METDQECPRTWKQHCMEARTPKTCLTLPSLKFFADILLAGSGGIIDLHLGGIVINLLLGGRVVDLLLSGGGTEPLLNGGDGDNDALIGAGNKDIREISYICKLQKEEINSNVMFT